MKQDKYFYEKKLLHDNLGMIDKGLNEENKMLIRAQSLSRISLASTNNFFMNDGIRCIY